MAKDTATFPLVNSREAAVFIQLPFICYLAAIACFVIAWLAALGVIPRGGSSGWLGLAFFALPLLVETWPG
jgi:hypothetical protein